MNQNNYGKLLSKISFCIKDLKDFDFYLKLSEEQLKKSLAEYKKSLANRTFKQRDYYNNRRDLFAFLNDDMPNIQRSSQLIYLLSFLENNLSMICKWFFENMDFKLSHEELKGGPLQRTYKFLVKVVGIDLSTIQDTWTNIQAIQRIRNIIVHRNRIISDFTVEKDLKYINDNSEYFSIYNAGDYKELQINLAFINFSMEEIKQFFNQIHNEIKNKI